MDVNKILNDQQSKMSFLRGLIRVAKCDNNVDPNEKVYFMQVCQNFGLDDEAQNEISEAWETNKKIIFNFERNEQKMFFFIQAIQLCWIDDSYDELERKEIRNIADELGITELAIEKVEAWVLEGMEWNKRANDLLVLR